MHDETYEDLKQSVLLTEPDQFATGTPVYKLTVYPSDEFNGTYDTRGPEIAAIASIGAIVFTSMIFLLYDFLVHRDLGAKQDLLEARRQFMRFVSVGGLGFVKSDAASGFHGKYWKATQCLFLFLRSFAN